MSDLDIALEKILDEDDNVKSEKEQDAMDEAESSDKNPTNKIPEPSLSKVIALLREALKLHTSQNTGLVSIVEWGKKRTICTNPNIFGTILRIRTKFLGKILVFPKSFGAKKTPIAQSFGKKY